VADVSGTGELGQSIDRDAEQRVGLGLLSRFIGAVFLVLLGGLLLLDRALLRANRNQAQLDVQSGALLTESFIAADEELLDRIAALVVARSDARDSTLLRAEMSRMLNRVPSVRRAWATTSDGRQVLAMSRSDSAFAPVPPGLLDSLDRIRSQNRLAISVTQRVSYDSARGALISMLRPLGGVDTMSRIASDSSSGLGTVGIVVDAQALQQLLSRTSADTRMALLVLSGADTLMLLGTGLDREHVLVGAVAHAIVRLPNGGTWTVVATHALTTRSQRWGMWALGVAGVLFLALGLLREQRRALHVAARSVELERLYSDVKRANQAKSEFLANVSHELRTPLNAIVGFVELLRDGFYGDLSPRQVPPVDRIAASATHLRHLVDQVLDIAKIAAGRLEVHTETIVLRPFVLNVASELESLVSEKGLALSITVGASLPRVRTDPTHLRQILINLIGNAVKYTPTGSVSVRARLLGAPEDFSSRTPMPRAGMDDPSAAALLARAPRTGIWIALQVIDTGVGIAAGDMARIFDEFEQVNAGPRGDSMQRGTGLGLAISRRLARLLGGDISVESVLSRGSTFTIWLPVSPADLARERPTSVDAVPLTTS
jgi:signal transduction histidine kinase